MRSRHIGRLRIWTAVLTVGYSSALFGGTVYWDGGTDSNWTNHANWSTGAVPASADDVVLNESPYGSAYTVNISAFTQSIDSLTTDATSSLSIGTATLSIAAASTINSNLTMNGGTLAGAGNLTVNGNFSVGASGALLDGTGQVTLSTTSTSTISGELNMQQHIVNQGTLTITSGGFIYDPTYYIMGNFGSFTQKGTGTSTIDFANQAGAWVDVQGGTLKLYSTGQQSGTFETDSGATLYLTNSSSYPNIILNSTATIGGAGNLTIDTSGTSAGTCSDAATINIGGAAEIIAGTCYFNSTFSCSGFSTSASTTFNAATTIAGTAYLASPGASILGSGNVTFSGTLNWSAGTFNSTGTTYITSATTPNTATLNISSKTNALILSGVLESDGTTTWSAPAANAQPLEAKTATFNNKGTFTVTGTNAVEYEAYTGTNVFNNSGIFNDDDSGTVSFADSAYGSTVAFNNTGSVNVQAGTLVLMNGGTQNGSFNISAGAELGLAGTHTFSAASTVTGAGNLVIGYGNNTSTATFSGPINFAGTIGGSNLVMNAAATLGGLNTSSLSGTGSVTVTGALDWTGTMSSTGSNVSSISSSGTTPNTATMAIGGSGADTYLTGRTLENDGAATLSYYMTLTNATFNNKGSLAVDTTYYCEILNGSGTGVFNNSGSWSITGYDTIILSSTIPANAMTFNNSGTVDVNGGPLEIQANGSDSGSYSVESTLEFEAAHTLTAASSITGTGNGTLSLINGNGVSPSITDAGTVNVPTAEFSNGSGTFSGAFAASYLYINNTTTFNGTTSAGTLSVSGTMTGSGTVTASKSLGWSGTMSGTGTTIVSSGISPNEATLGISGSTATLSRVLENDGAATWSGTKISAGGSTFNNNGTFTINQSANALYESTVASSSNTFSNAGTFTKQGSGSVEFETNASGSTLTFNNSGTLKVQAGVLEFSGAAGTAFNNTGTVNIAGGTLKLDEGLASGTILSQLLSGFNNGAWNGTGMISSLAAADPKHATGVGYTLNGSAYTLLDTWLGDTDLNGVVNNADLLAMAPVGTTNATWSQGDFNYDGIVNADDYSLFMVGDAYQTGSFPTVPEPEMLIVGFGIFVAGWRKRKPTA